MEARHGFENAVVAVLCQGAPLSSNATRIDVDEPVELHPARPMFGIPGARTEFEIVGTIFVLRRQRNPDDTGAAPTQHSDRTVLSLRRIVFVGDPRPDDLTGIGVAVGVGLVSEGRRGGFVTASARSAGSKRGDHGLQQLLGHRRSLAGRPVGVDWYRRPMIGCIAWDFGNVLIEWDPRNLYRSHLDEGPMEEFLATVWTPEMNDRLDRGERLADLVAELVTRFPHEHELIELYDTAWTDMLGPPIPGSLELVRELASLGLPQFGLSNWSPETFARAQGEVEAFGLLDGWVLSGEVGVCKPQPEIYDALSRRFDIDPTTCLFIDDKAENCDAARGCGFLATRFTGVDPLRAELAERGVSVATAETA